MIKRIDLFVPYRSLYNVLNVFTLDLASALTRQGISCRILEADRNNPHQFLDQLFEDAPDCTLSFNGLLPDEEGRFFCDLIQIPHIACLVDAPTHFLPLASSPLTMITSVDRLSCAFFQEMDDHAAYFMPHGVNKDLHALEGGIHEYEVVMLSSCIDYEKIKQDWTKRFPPSIVNTLNEAAEVALTQPKVSYMHAFIQELDKQVKSGNPIDPQINPVELMDMLEQYIRGRDRVELVRGIKNATVDVFGAPSEDKSWSDFFKDMPNVRCHPQVSFEKAIQIMQKAKIVLSSCAWIKDGIHERILAATKVGALAVCQENPYLIENFPSGESLLYYNYGDWKTINDQIDYFLAHPQERNARIEQGQSLVANRHTWDHRANQLLHDIDIHLSREL